MADKQTGTGARGKNTRQAEGQKTGSAKESTRRSKQSRPGANKSDQSPDRAGNPRRS